MLSDFVYRFYERPLREKFFPKVKFVIFFLIFGAIVGGISSAVVTGHMNFLDRSQVEIYTPRNIQDGEQERFRTRIKICKSKGWDLCDVPVNNQTNVLVMGDSHAIDALNAIYSIFPQFDYSMSQLAGCPPTNYMEKLVPRTFPDLASCIKLNKMRYDINYLKKFDVLLINVLTGWYSQGDLLNYLDFLHKSGIKKVIIFGSYFELDASLPSLINQFGFDIETVKKHQLKKFDDEMFLSDNASRFNYLYISKREVFCPINNCKYWYQQIPYTWDMHHLSFPFAIRILNDIKENVGKYIFSK